MLDLRKLEQATPGKLRRRFVYQMVGSKPEGKLLFGAGAIQQLGEEIERLELGSNRILIVTDKTITELGIAAQVEAILLAKRFEVELFNEVEPEPHVETAQEVANVARIGKFGAIVGLGGGSCLDMGKMASVMVTNTGPVEEYLRGKTLAKPGVPKVLVPTTSGTGSEVSPYIVCSAGQQKLFIDSPYLFADIALVDPLLTVTMPPRVTVYTGLDALSHAIEGMTSLNALPISEAFGLKAIRYIVAYLDRACRNGQDLEARYFMSWASVLGMLAYVRVGGLYAHSFSYVMTLNKGWPHGLGCGYALPYTLAFNLDFVQDILAEIAVSIGKASAVEDPRKAAVKAVIALQELNSRLGMPSRLAEMGIMESELSVFASELVGKYYRKSNPREMTLDDSIRLFRAMWEGELSI